MKWDIKKFFGRRSEPEETPKEPPQEQLTREVSIHANERPTGKSFNKKLIYGLLMLFVVAFACALMFGMSDNKKKVKEEEIETQAIKGDHLSNVPKKYSDTQTTPQKKPPAKEPTPSPTYTAPPSYTPVPQPRIQTAPPAAPVISPAPKSGLSQEEKIQIERAKEKMAANKSPIRFSLGEEEKTSEKSDKKD